jgi:hypothetical protein
MMKFLKLCWLPFLLIALFLVGCSQSNEDDVRKAKRFEALKGLPLDTVLTRAYKFYEQYKATNDTLLRDSMDDYRDHFFARWKLSTDSICATVPADDSLAADLREIYKVVMEFDAKRKYHYILNREKRDSLQAFLYEEMQKVKLFGIDDILDDLERRRENPDSMRAVQNQRDSAENAEIWSVPLEEAISGMKEDSSSVHNVVYFVQTMEVFYADTSVSDMNELDKIDRHRIKRNTWKETKSACLGRTSMGQKVLILNKEYESLLNNFMRANVHESRSERYTILPVKYPFWHPMISVVPHHSGDDFHFESFPAMGGALFNKNHDMVILSVEESFNSGSYYYLAKKNGKWELIMHKDGWVA